MKQFLSIFIFLCFGYTGVQAQQRLDTTIVNNIVLHTASGDLYGTLNVPAAKKKMPVVLLVPGGGPVDRNGNTHSFTNNAYKLLADSLFKKGIATLRYDKRAIGASKAAVKSEREIRFDDYVPDVVGWVQLLKKDKRFSKTVVLGHDEGAVIAIYALMQVKADAFISVDGPGESADKQMKKQLKEKINKQGFLDSCYSMIDILKTGKTIDDVPKPMMRMFRPDIQRYIISWFRFDPQAEITKLTLPILIIQGTSDLLVAPENGQLLANANPKAKLIIIDSMNHAFRPATTDPIKNTEVSMDARLPIMKELVDAVVGFVRKN